MTHVVKVTEFSFLTSKGDQKALKAALFFYKKEVKCERGLIETFFGQNNSYILY